MHGLLLFHSYYLFIWCVKNLLFYRIIGTNIDKIKFKEALSALLLIFGRLLQHVQFLVVECVLFDLSSLNCEVWVGI